MKIIDKISSFAQSRPLFTFEFFPPRTDQACPLFPVFKPAHWLQGFDNLLSRIDRLALPNPLAVSVTWGAGGSTKDKSIELASLTQNDHNLTTLLHLTCTNAELGQVDAALQVCVLTTVLDASSHVISFRQRKNVVSRTFLLSAAVSPVLAISLSHIPPDPPRGQEEWTPSDLRFQHAIDLVKYIRKTHGSHFCIGVAGTPLILLAPSPPVHMSSQPTPMAIPTISSIRM